MSYPNYLKTAKQNAQRLRNNSTKSEILLWLVLKRKQLGFRFIRQKPVGKYIVDFYCKELNLAIEIDGDYHYEVIEQDAHRQKYLEAVGITVLRYRAEDVEKSPEGVAMLIKKRIKSNM